MNFEAVFADQFINHIKSLFPEENDYTAIQISENFGCEISWYLKKYAQRPHKRSKKIIIKITREALEDYDKLADQEKKMAQSKFYKFISMQYNNFDPQHDNSRDEEPPEVEWVVKSDILL